MLAVGFELAVVFNGGSIKLVKDELSRAVGKGDEDGIAADDMGGADPDAGPGEMLLLDAEVLVADCGAPEPAPCAADRTGDDVVWSGAITIEIGWPHKVRGPVTKVLVNFLPRNADTSVELPVNVPVHPPRCPSSSYVYA